MSPAVLESYVRQYIEAQEVPEITFAWQGGEPTLMGLDFFRQAVALQQKYCPPGKLQTNGVLLNAEWCRFFRENNFLLGLSLDGPRELHDRYRVDKGGAPTFDRVMRALALLRAERVEFNALTVVHRHNAARPLEVYRFLREHGVQFMQFIPLVERCGDDGSVLAGPPSREGAERAGPEEHPPMTPWSVPPLAFGEFLCAVFDEWIRTDVGAVFVQIFETQLGVWMGLPASLCVFAETCGDAFILEHNGDLYACDHYVYPEYNRGNITRQALTGLAALPAQKAFGAAKRDALPGVCRACDVLFACRGECPKHRFMRTANGEAGLSYLCLAYKRFFHHIDPYMKMFVKLLRAQRSPAAIMGQLARKERGW